MPASRNEITQILHVLRQATHLADYALVTVVALEGSGYRRTGARMLVHREGNWTGAISGGCLEGNALRRAREVMLSRQPQLVTYDTRSDESAKEIGASLGCNGVLKVWIEPLNPHSLNDLEKLAGAFLLPQESWFFRELDAKSIGLHEAGGAKSWNLHLEEGLQYSHIEGERVLCSVEKVVPATRLLVFGGGHDARPVTELAQQLGWRVTVTDDCAAKALPVRFPAADLVLQLPREQAAGHLQPDEFTAALLISHNYGYDKAILQGLAAFDLPYIGILGPRSRFERLDAELGGSLSANPAVYAPVGLDIGGQTPFGIAVSIVAEIQAVMAGREGGSLRERKGSIHPRKVEMA